MKDEEIVQKMKDQVLQNSELAELDLKISCEDCVVYLDGDAKMWEQVVTLGHLAGSIDEVRGVVNRVCLPTLELPKREKKAVEKASWDGMRADLVIVGAGIVGAAIARELSRYDLKVVLVEKEAGVGWGQTKGGASWVHGFAGVDVDPKSLKARLCVEGNKLYDDLAEELEFPFKRTGLLAIVRDEELVPVLGSIKGIIEEHGSEVKVIRDKEEVFELEPQITDEALAAVYFPTYGVVSPYLVAIALAENAKMNGVKLLLRTEVMDVEVENDQIKSVITNRGTIFTDFLINAAGLYADEIAEMAGAREFTIHPRKGEMIILDSKCGDLCSHNLAPAELETDPYTKGGGIALTIDGNLLWGPTAEEVPFKEDLTTTREGVEKIWDKFSPFLPDVPKSMIITAFSGVRAPTYTEDFCIAASEKVRGLINVAGIQSPGITASPAIAKMVLRILHDEGLELKERSDFNPRRSAIPSFRDLSNEDRKRLIAQNPAYGHVVCRCEHVTEGEVVEAIRRGATTLDGIKFRTRAGMGRCQGGFCTPRIVKILARELAIPVEDVTKRGGDSKLLPYKIKSLLEGD